MASTSSTTSAIVGSTTPASTHVLSLAADLVATQPATPVGQHQLADGIARALDLDALEPAPGVRPLAEPTLLPLVEHPHPFVQ